MDNRLQEIVDNFDILKIGPDEPFKFHCTMCGKCCINREDILLNPLDLFRVSKELRMTPKDFVSEYCEAYLGQSSKFPIVRLLPRGSIKRCPFLKDRKCSIHNAKPTVCAMFPLGRVVQIKDDKINDEPITADQIQYIFMDPGCGDETETHTVREWFSGFGIPVEDDFYVRWQNVVCQTGPFIEKGIATFSEMTMTKIITLIYVKLYLDYETDKDFLPQFLKNAESIFALKKIIPAVQGG